jgi:hypothetical protein
MYFAKTLRLALLGALLNVPCSAEAVSNVAIIGSYPSSWTRTVLDQDPPRVVPFLSKMLFALFDHTILHRLIGSIQELVLQDRRRRSIYGGML